MQRTVSTERARQGKLGRPVFLVLVSSLFLCLVYLIGMSVWALFQDVRPVLQHSAIVEQREG